MNNGDARALLCKWQLVPVAGLIMLAGCVTMPTAPSVNELSLSKPVVEGKARIVFTRTSSMLGAVVSHYLIDRGTGIQRNVWLAENTSQDSPRGNYDLAGNIAMLAYASQESISQGAPDIKALIGTPRSSGDVRDAKAMFIGTVCNGQTLAWDRNPGMMRLEVVTPGGDHAFAPHMSVEAGKTYYVRYYYSRARFEIMSQ